MIILSESGNAIPVRFFNRSRVPVPCYDKSHREPSSLKGGILCREETDEDPWEWGLSPDEEPVFARAMPPRVTPTPPPDVGWVSAMGRDYGAAAEEADSVFSDGAETHGPIISRPIPKRKKRHLRRKLIPFDGNWIPSSADWTKLKIVITRNKPA